MKDRIEDIILHMNTKILGFITWESTIGSQDLWIGAGAMWPKTTSGCAALAKTEMTTSLLNIQSGDIASPVFIHNGTILNGNPYP